MIEKSVALMDKLGTALLSTKVVGESEPSVFKTEELYMVLDRQTPSVLERKLLQGPDGNSDLSFPSRKVLTKNYQVPVQSLDVQVSDQCLPLWLCCLAWMTDRLTDRFQFNTLTFFSVFQG